MGSAMSPAARNPEEEKVYLEKLKHLQKYVEPLRRMIARIEKEEGIDCNLFHLSLLLSL